jgi:hypothetical protein
MGDQKDKPPAPEVFIDENEADASHLYEKFNKEKAPPELLLQGSEQMVLSANPEAKQISILFKALYYREKGIKDKDDKKARKYLLKSITEFKKIEKPDSVILKRIELEFLKRKLGYDLARPDPKVLQRRATLFRELGQDKDYNQEMSLFYMFVIMDQFDKLNNVDVLKYADLMLDHAKKGLSNELLYKMQAFYHQLRANTAFNPKDRVKELEKAVVVIQKTSDKFGEETIETEVQMAKAMSTTDRRKRNIILEKVAKDYKKRGLKKREDFVRNMMYPIPIKAAKIIYLCDKSIEKVRVIEKKLVSLRVLGKPAAIFYHIGYLIERINDVQRIMMRMALARKELTDLEIKQHALTPVKIIPRKPYPKRLQAVSRRSNNLREQMRQDMESLLIYGNLLLDQWSYIISYIAGYEVPKDRKEIADGKKDLHFAGLLDLLQAKGYSGELLLFWNLHKKDIIWLNFHLRSYRNVFVEHMRKPWQRGTTMASYGDDFNFHIPAPVGYINEAEKKKILEDVYKLAPKKLKDMPDDYWEKKNLHRALEVTLYYIDELENQSDRDKVWEAWHKLGGSAPSYDTIGIRLLNYIFTSLDTINVFIDQYPKIIKFGEFS